MKYSLLTKIGIFIFFGWGFAVSFSNSNPVPATAPSDSGEEQSGEGLQNGKGVVVVENNTSSNPEVMKFIDEIARRYQNLSREKLIRLFDKVSLNHEIQKKISNNLHYPAEKVKDWDSYRQQFVNPQRIDAGVRFFEKHLRLIKEVSERFQVPVSIILATLGLESHYGEAEYRYPVFLSLVLNGFVNNRRREFYLKQLEYFLILAERNRYPDEEILNIMGSYSGAIGPAQFIPSSVDYYGYDFNQDGTVDMLYSYPDIIASIANYFKKNGWKSSNKVLKKLPPPCPAGKNILVVGSGKGQSCWKKEKNFNVLLSYNHNNFYALALYQLSQALSQALKLNEE